MKDKTTIPRRLRLAALGLTLPGCALAFEPITIADQGAFMAGGTIKTAPGAYSPLAPKTDGQTLHGDHAAVRYQIPIHARKLPLVFLHGYGQSSRT